MEKMIANILETVAAALLFSFLLGSFWNFLVVISGY